MRVQDALLNRYFISSEKIAVAGDGGTIGFQLVDAEGEIHMLFIDRRIGTKTRDHLYATDYPTDSKSIHLGLHEHILTELEKTMLDKDRAR